MIRPTRGTVEGLSGELIRVVAGGWQRLILCSSSKLAQSIPSGGRWRPCGLEHGGAK